MLTLFYDINIILNVPAPETIVLLPKNRQNDLNIN